MQRCLGFLAVSLIAVGNALAQQSGSVLGPKPPEWLTLDSIREMEAQGEENLEDLDFFVLMAAGADLEGTGDPVAVEAARKKKLAPFVLLAKYSLAKLFYDVSFDAALHPAYDPPFHAALIAFEETAGLTVDGKLTRSEFAHLNFLADVQHEPVILVPGKHVVGDGKYFVSAQGTWVIQGEQIAYPINSSLIQCWRDAGTCTDFQVSLALPTVARRNSAHLIMPDIQVYEITDWTDGEVRAVIRSQCRQNELVIQLKTETVHTLGTDLTKEGCPLTGPLGQPRLSTLEDGFQISWDYFEERQKSLKGITQSPFEGIRTMLEDTEK